MDRRDRLEFLSFRDPKILSDHNLNTHQASLRIQARDEEGTLVEGIDTLMLIARHIPALYPWLPFIWLSQFLGFGNHFYDLLASIRYGFPIPSCRGTCEKKGRG
jgi:predicted DCC family thiol-disulfide oxidoreductase YuxK